MGKHYGGSLRQADPGPSRPDIHPVWRGIGWVLMILTPILGYFCALALIEANKVNEWFRIPKGLIYHNEISFLPHDPLLIVKALLTIIVAFILFFLFQLITMILYRITAPPQYGPFDVPRQAFRGKKKSR